MILLCSLVVGALLSLSQTPVSQKLMLRDFTEKYTWSEKNKCGLSEISWTDMLEVEGEWSSIMLGFINGRTGAVLQGGSCVGDWQISVV